MLEAVDKVVPVDDLTLDLDAYTGGFNLQIAWATGRLAGQSAANEKE